VRCDVGRVRLHHLLPSNWHPRFLQGVEEHLGVSEVLEHWPFAGTLDAKMWH
jgi:hypothetical protein